MTLIFVFLHLLTYVVNYEAFCSLLLSLFVVAFYAQEQGSAIGFYTTGLEHYNHQNYEDAIAEYSKAIE